MADTNGDIKPAPAPAGAAVVVEPPLAPLRKLPPKMDHKTAFQGTSALDKSKAYLKELPMLRARLVKVIEEQEEISKRAKTSLDSFDATTARIKEIVTSWEEQNDAGQHAAPDAGSGRTEGAAAPAAVEGGAEPRG